MYFTLCLVLWYDEWIPINIVNKGFVFVLINLDLYRPKPKGEKWWGDMWVQRLYSIVMQPWPTSNDIDKGSETIPSESNPFFFAQYKLRPNIS